MNHLSSESISKISDGILNAIKLILFYALTSLLVLPVSQFFQRPGKLIYILLLLAIASFEFQRTIQSGSSEPRRGWHGMAAGLFFWQVIWFTADLSGFQLFQGVAIIFWVMAVIMTLVLWKKVFPIGVRSMMTVLLVCWLGKIYQTGYTFLLDWPPIINFGYEALRYLAGLAGMASLFLILFRSHDYSSRIYYAIAVFAGAMFVAMAF